MGLTGFLCSGVNVGLQRHSATLGHFSFCFFEKNYHIGWTHGQMEETQTNQKTLVKHLPSSSPAQSMEMQQASQASTVLVTWTHGGPVTYRKRFSANASIAAIKDDLVNPPE